MAQESDALRRWKAHQKTQEYYKKPPTPTQELAALKRENARLLTKIRDLETQLFRVDECEKSKAWRREQAERPTAYKKILAQRAAERKAKRTGTP